MVFSSIEFLFYFLPLVLGLYFIAPEAARNGILLGASLLFYAWGELHYVAIMLVSIGVNYVVALQLERSRRWLAIGIAFNLGLLITFKYANFASEVITGEERLGIHLPLGISFFTFQAMSYLIDVFRGDVEAERRPVRVALYIALFPQLIAGPIVRFKQIAAELGARRVTLEQTALGIQIFIWGLAQKVLLANTLARPADEVFAADPALITTAGAWLGITCYALQIFFDFAGYSLMAIGLGRIFGFSFPENFNYPYIATSITDFWRRWHMSLSTWFRDYLYIPLGGNRRGEWQTYRNLVVVFILCGFWHGAAWTFLLWGLYHGAFLVLERAGLRKQLAKLWRPLQHAYLILAVLGGWVLFRATSLEHAGSFYRRLIGIGGSEAWKGLSFFADLEVWAIGVVALALCSPALETGIKRRMAFGERRQLLTGVGWGLLIATGLTLITMKLMAGAYNPFIYFRF